MTLRLSLARAGKEADISADLCAARERFHRARRITQAQPGSRPPQRAVVDDPRWTRSAETGGRYSLWLLTGALSNEACYTHSALPGTSLATSSRSLTAKRRTDIHALDPPVSRRCGVDSLRPQAHRCRLPPAYARWEESVTSSCKAVSHPAERSRHSILHLPVQPTNDFGCFLYLLLMCIVSTLTITVIESPVCTVRTWRHSR